MRLAKLGPRETTPKIDRERGGAIELLNPDNLVSAIMRSLMSLACNAKGSRSRAEGLDNEEKLKSCFMEGKTYRTRLQTHEPIHVHRTPD